MKNYNNMNKNPLELCNAEIQAIGEHYFAEKGAFSFKKKADALAQQLVDYDEDSSPQQKWAFLAECYRSVSDHSSFLARQIKNTFCDYFPSINNVLEGDHKKSTRPNLGIRSVACILEGHADDYFKNLHQRQHPQTIEARIKGDPAKLTMSMVQEIGRAYLKRHGQTASCFSCIFRKHNNHAQAKELKHFNKISNKDCWNKLAEIYASLPNNRGEMATEIRGIFKSAFGQHAAHLDQLKSTKLVASELKTILYQQSTSRKLAYQLMTA